MKKLCNHIFVFISALFLKLLVDEHNESNNKESNRSNSKEFVDAKEELLREEINSTLVNLIESYNEDLMPLLSNSNVI